MPTRQPIDAACPLPPCRTRATTTRALAAGLCVLAGSLAAVGCASPGPTATPMLDTRNPALKLNQRLDAADIAWASTEGSPSDRAKAREIFKSIVWSDATPAPLRRKLAEHLLTDTSPEGITDSRSFTALRLPTEPDRSIVGMMALAAARNGWQDAAAPLVRGLADPVRDIPERERVEALAIQKLFPGRDLEEIVFDIFLGNDPAGNGLASGAPDASLDIFASRVRTDAWTVLGRLDPEGDRRRALVLDGSVTASGPSATKLADLRAGVRELRVMPTTGDELEWLARLREASGTNADPAARAWWRRVAELASRLTVAQARGLELRHLEPLRVASETSPSLLSMSTRDLFAELESRLETRPRNRRTAELDGYKGRSPERPADWADELVWADLLTILVIDDAVVTPEFARVMLQQAELDRDDKETEYGGVVEAVNNADGSVVSTRAVLFPPRPRDRVGDGQFIASRDMIEYSDRALAHYHLQVQREKNYKFAGPSSGDLRYAALSGRSCVVFTSLSRDTLGVDYYQPDGATIDLGEISPPE